MADKSSRTEQPTPHRIDKARKEGQFSSSREMLGAAQFLVFVYLLSRWGPEWFVEAGNAMRALVGVAFRSDLGPSGLLGAYRAALVGCLTPLAWLGGALLVLSLGSQLAMTRMGFSFKRLAPDVNRLNPLARIRDLWRQNLWALIKALVILPLAGIAVWVIARDNLPLYLSMPLMGVQNGARQLADSLVGLLWKAAGVFLAMGAIDMARERRRYTAELRMSRQELREEVKNMEGNPHVKARLRRLQRELVRRQMMKEVKTATAVIVNPTHYAVAIRYRMETMDAPVVVAKGRGLIYQRIREIATENQVPLFENPPLAQALYKTVKVGQEIPAHLYRAVAEILAYIYRLMNGRLPG